MTSKVQPAVDYWTVDRKTWGWGCVIFGWQKNKELIFSLRVRKYFEWILQIAERVIHLGLRPRWITPSLICKILHNLRKLNSIMGHYFFFQRGREVNKRPRSSIKHRSVREEGERRKYRNGYSFSKEVRLLYFALSRPHVYPLRPRNKVLWTVWPVPTYAPFTPKLKHV